MILGRNVYSHYSTSNGNREGYNLETHIPLFRDSEKLFGKEIRSTLRHIIYKRGFSNHLINAHLVRLK
jgi:hypothetical protein